MVLTHRKACIQCADMKDIQAAVGALVHAGYTTVVLYVDNRQDAGQGRYTVEGKWEGLRGLDADSMVEMTGGRNW